MSNNENENSLPASGQAALVHDTDNYVEALQRCKVSKQTAGLMACILLLYDVHDGVFVELSKMYGEKRANDIIGNGIEKAFETIESLLYGFVNDSISENINAINLNQI